MKLIITSKASRALMLTMAFLLPEAFLFSIITTDCAAQHGWATCLTWTKFMESARRRARS